MLQGWLVLREMLHPLYLFQLYSVIIWLCQTEYYVFGAFVAFVSLVAVLVNALTQYWDSRRWVVHSFQCWIMFHGVACGAMRAGPGVAQHTDGLVQRIPQIRISAFLHC